jgi:hypothetical protein
VSLSLREELRIVLSPQQVLLVRIGREFTRRGLTRRVLEKRAVACAEASAGDAPWHGAVQTLEAELHGLADNTAFATVILSSHYMHYALVPWSGALRDEQEESAFARHFFRQLYGSAADSWELRLSPGRSGAAQLASAADSQLTEAVRTLFKGAGIKLRSIQPNLMVAYNSCRNRLEKSSAWFVLFEAGSLCIALLQQGSWGSVRRLRVDGGWRDALPLLLEREAYLNDANTTTDEIFLWAPELEKSAWPESARWKIHALQPVIRPGLLPDYDKRYAVAMSG